MNCICHFKILSIYDDYSTSFQKENLEGYILYTGLINPNAISLLKYGVKYLGQKTTALNKRDLHNLGHRCQI